jgi:hypothetical protein
MTSSDEVSENSEEFTVVSESSCEFSSESTVVSESSETLKGYFLFFFLTKQLILNNAVSKHKLHHAVRRINLSMKQVPDPCILKFLFVNVIGFILKLQ